MAGTKPVASGPTETKQRLRCSLYSGASCAVARAMGHLLSGGYRGEAGSSFIVEAITSASLDGHVSVTSKRASFQREEIQR